MSTSLSDLRTLIRTEISRGTAALPDARIDQAVKAVIRVNKGNRYGFNQLRAGLTIGTEYVTLPGDVLAVDRIKMDFTSYVKPLIKKSPVYLEERKRSPNWTSYPVYYAIQRNGSNREVRVYPVPAASYSAEMVYLSDLAYSASWTDNLTLAWFDDGFDMVFYGALAELSASFDGDPDAVQKATTWATMAKKAEKELRQNAASEGASGSIEPCL